MKLKTLAIGVITKAILILIVSSAVVGSSAPFLHIFFEKTANEKLSLERAYDEGTIDKDHYLIEKNRLKEKYKFAGFTNIRRFFYAIGLPISIFLCSFILLICHKYIENINVKRGALVSGFCFQFTSLYFITWTIWAYKKSEDFPIELYYCSIILISILASMSIYYILKTCLSKTEKLQKALNAISSFAFIGVKKHIHPNHFEAYEKDSIETLKKGM